MKKLKGPFHLVLRDLKTHPFLGLNLVQLHSQRTGEKKEREREEKTNMGIKKRTENERKRERINEKREKERKKRVIELWAWNIQFLKRRIGEKKKLMDEWGKCEQFSQGQFLYCCERCNCN